MAAAGKKNKKNKWKAVELTSVLAETRPVSTAWADEVEIDERDIQLAAARKSVLPTAPRSARGSDDERVPHSPPFVAYITNLPFEMEEGDVVEFFGDLQIDNIRLPRNDGTQKLRGYGYVEFTERAGLIEALQMSDKSMKGRRIRIDVSENNDRDRGFGGRDRMGRDRMGMGMGREDQDPDRALGDWRSGPRSEPSGEDRDRMSRSSGRQGYGSGGFRDGDREREGFGAPRETDTREGGWREGMGSGTSGSSDRFGDRDRDTFRSRGFGDRDRDGYDRDRGSRYGGDRDGYGDRPRFGDRDGYGDRPRFGDRERDEERDRYPRRDEGPPPSDSSEPRARPRLQLQPRTRPVENPLPPPDEVKEKEKEREKPAPAPPVPRASIFGAAKPVDTQAREREIEERLAREKDRAPRRDDRDKSIDNSKSKESSEHGDEPHPSKKVEVAPPPKENAWSRRPRIEPNANNGDASHEDGGERRAVSPGNNENNRERQSRQSSSEVNEGRRAEFRNSEDIHSTRSGSRDKKEGSNRDQDFSHNRDDTNANDRYERRGGRGRVVPHGRGVGCVRVDKGGGVGNKSRQPPDRVSRKDHSNEDQSRMPKYEEKPIPNFVASNKYAYLNNDDDPED